MNDKSQASPGTTRLPCLRRGLRHWQPPAGQAPTREHGAPLSDRQKISKADRPYLSVTLDDPSFSATIYARLVEGEPGEHSLIWSRSKGD